MKKLYLVEVASTFRMRYVVEAREEQDAIDEVVMNEHDTDFKEFSQTHIGTQVFSSHEISAVDYMEMFDKDNDYLADWPDVKKAQFVNTVVYQDEK